MTELTTLPNPNYLFGFKNDQSGQWLYVVLQNVSTQTKRFDKFVLTEGVDLTFDVTGQYSYKVWEQVSPTNVDPANTTSMVEQGRAVVFDDEQQTPTYEPAGNAPKTYTE